MALADDYLDWHARLTREAWRWTRDDAAAQDLASTALEKCLRAEMRGQIVELAYAYRALRTTWLDQWRRERVIRWEELADVHSYEVDPLIELRVRAMLAFLPAHHQQLFLLIADGYHQVEIADLLGTTVHGVKKRIQRARWYARKVGLAA